MGLAILLFCALLVGFYAFALSLFARDMKENSACPETRRAARKKRHLRDNPWGFPYEDAP